MMSKKDREQGIRQYFVILIYAYYALNKMYMERFHKFSPVPEEPVLAVLDTSRHQKSNYWHNSPSKFS